MSQRERWLKQLIFMNADLPEVRGDCTQAAVASLMNVPRESVPEFHRHSEAYAFWTEFEEYFNRQELEVIRMSGNFCPECLYLASGSTVRGTKHMVVMKSDRLIHDPHPSNAGLVEVEMVWLIVPRDISMRPLFNQ